jgi:signal transduction histidine kinase
VEDDLTFFTDALRLRIVINNLLSNAIKYVDPKKEKSFVAVDMRVADGSLEVKVKDNGIGIKEEFKDQIWDIFFRGVSTIPGSGLGLYILKESVKNIKGQVDFESAEGEGTEFVVRLPELSTED